MIGATEETPYLDTPGILVAHPPAEGVPADQPIWIDAIALLPCDEKGETLLPWLGSLFLTCFAETSQAAMSVNLVKDRILFPDEIERFERDGRWLARVPLHFELGSELGHPLGPGRYHLQLTARQLQSKPVGLEVR